MAAISKKNVRLREKYHGCRRMVDIEVDLFANFAAFIRNKRIFYG